jgi:hypothetical protein
METADAKPLALKVALSVMWAFCVGIAAMAILDPGREIPNAPFYLLGAIFVAIFNVLVTRGRSLARVPFGVVALFMPGSWILVLVNYLGGTGSEWSWQEQAEYWTFSLSVLVAGALLYSAPVNRWIAAKQQSRRRRTSNQAAVTDNGKSS